MPEHREYFDLDLAMPDALLVCREAVAELDWEVVREDKTVIVCKEPQEALSFTCKMPARTPRGWP